MQFPIDINICSGIPINYHPGAFGYRRKKYVHPGVDLYCQPGTKVVAMEDSYFVSQGLFTGPSIGSPWWNETFYLMLKGESGIICYGEIIVTENFGTKTDKGLFVKKGEVIGTVIPVLPESKARKDIPGHSNYMLHIELYDNSALEPVTWEENEPKPSCLKDITPYLMKFADLKILVHD